MKNVKAYFNDDIEQKIISLIKSAKIRIYVAVAWLTKKEIIDEIIDLRNDMKKKEISIKILVDYHIGNKSDEQIKLIKKKNKIDFYVWDDGRDKSNFMHHKFCVIDNNVVTGSYNWTLGASIYNEENIVVIKNRKLADKFEEAFNTIIDNNQIVTKITKKKKYNNAFREKPKFEKK